MQTKELRIIELESMLRESEQFAAQMEVELDRVKAALDKITQIAQDNGEYD